MKKNLLTYLSHNFCINCCGDMKKLDCDSRNVTCDKLANFLVGCNLYKEEINEEELDKLAHNYYCNTPRHKYVSEEVQDAYKAGYRKAWEDKKI